MVARDLQLGKKTPENINHFLLRNCLKSYKAAQKIFQNTSFIIIMLPIHFKKFSFYL